MGYFVSVHGAVPVWSWGKSSMSAARQAALQGCRKHGPDCRIEEVHTDQKGDWTLSASCKRNLAGWQEKAGKGAFAVEQGGACGWSWGGRTMSAARKAALRRCGKYGPSCKVVRTK